MTMRMILSMVVSFGPYRNLGARHLAVDHPGRAEAVFQHAEGFGPEGLLERHVHLAAFGQGVEHPLRLGDRRVAQREREPLLPRVGLASQPVGRHQDASVLENEAGVQGMVAGAGRHLGGSGGIRRFHQVELAAQRALVEAHRVSAVAVEEQVGTEIGHGELLLCRWSPSLALSSPKKQLPRTTVGSMRYTVTMVIKR